MLFFVYCLSIEEKKSFFGTYALDISSLTSSLKYISEKYYNLCCVYFFYFKGFFMRDCQVRLGGFSSLFRVIWKPSWNGHCSADGWALSLLKVRVHTAADRQALDQFSNVFGPMEQLHNHLFTETLPSFASEKCSWQAHDGSDWREHVTTPQPEDKRPQLTPPWLENLISRTNITSVHDGLSQSTAIRWPQT